jgi:hypothetical protein
MCLFLGNGQDSATGCEPDGIVQDLEIADPGNEGDGCGWLAVPPLGVIWVLRESNQPGRLLSLLLLARFAHISTKRAEIGRAGCCPPCDYAAPIHRVNLAPRKIEFFEAIQCSCDSRLCDVQFRS